MDRRKKSRASFWSQVHTQAQTISRLQAQLQRHQCSRFHRTERYQDVSGPQRRTRPQEKPEGKTWMVWVVEKEPVTCHIDSADRQTRSTHSVRHLLNNREDCKAGLQFPNTPERAIRWEQIIAIQYSTPSQSFQRKEKWCCALSWCLIAAWLCYRISHLGWQWCFQCHFWFTFTNLYIYRFAIPFFLNITLNRTAFVWNRKLF